jgi:hypothetical protein
MIDKLGLVFSVISVLSGATLVYDSISELATSQTAQLLTGATLLAIGLFTAFHVVESWRRWRKHSKVADTSEIESFNSNHGGS